ncbi:unnamed protein product, partial [marine sediment metagenome]
RNISKFEEIKVTATDIYIQHKIGERTSPVIGMDLDHYITRDLAKKNPPYWFTSYCTNKVTIQNHIYCKGIPKLN